MRRREINLFSISFLDLLSGALAAVLILFIIVPKMQSEDAETLKEFEALEMEVSTIKDKLEELKNSVSKEIFKELEEQFNEMEAEIEKLEKTISTLKSKVENLEKALKECEEEKSKLEEEIEELKKKIEETEAKLKTTKEENIALDSEIKQLESRVTNAERALSITKKLDIVFVLDCTSSMEDEIEDLKANLLGIVRILQKTVESLHIGFVAYRDKGTEEEFITKKLQIESAEGGGLNRLISFVNKLEAKAGGDEPEAVHKGLEVAANLNWRSDVKQVIVLIGDAGAHTEHISSCYTTAKKFRNRPEESKVSTVYANSKDEYKDFFVLVANNGGGEFVREKGRMMESILLSVMD